MPFPAFLVAVVVSGASAPHPPPAAAASETVAFDPARPLKGAGWREKVYNRPVRWEVADDGGPVLHGVSEGAASMLHRGLVFDANDFPLVSWRWKVMRLPGKGPGNGRRNDDYGARIYFFFPGRAFLDSHVIEYVWDNDAPPGTIKTSPSSRRCKLVVASSGSDGLGGWTAVERDLRDDFVRAFGRPPDRRVGGIGFMTDSDDTRSSAEAFYGPVTVRARPAAAASR